MLGLPVWLGSCLADSAYSEARYQASIRRTSHGVAHILARDIGSAGFGQGYAFAEDHACVLADQILKVRSERSKFFGADRVAGSGDLLNLGSDFAYKHLEILPRAEVALAGQTEDVRALIDGYAAGFNQYLTDVGTDNVPGVC